MRKIFIAAVLFCMFSANAQAPAKFELTPQGFTDFVVTEMPGKSKVELFKSTTDWIQVAFKTADAIKSTVEGDKLTFEGKGKIVSMDGAMKLTYDSRFLVEVTFKDGRYKFDLVKLEYLTERTQHGAGGWREVQLTDVTNYYTKQGTLRPVNKYFPEIADYFNRINDELKQFISSGAKVQTKSSDW